jgi:hypothetical protein
MTGNVPVWKVSKHTTVSSSNNNNNSNNNNINNNNNKADLSVGSNPAGGMDVCIY